jgi:hypothetical protein
MGKKTRRARVKVSGYKRKGSRKVRLKRRRGLKTVYVYESRRRRRRSPKRRRHTAARRRTHRRRRSMRENPIFVADTGALENPLSRGELAAAFVSGTIGYIAAEVLGRYVATYGSDSKVTNISNIVGAPDWKQMAAKGGATVVPLAAAYFVRNPMGRSILQGAGLGAGINLLGQLVKTFVLAKLLKDNPTAQTKLFPDIIDAEAAQPVGVNGLPVGVGAYVPTAVPSLRSPNRIPTASSGDGGAVRTAGTTITTPGGVRSSGGGVRTPAPVGVPAGGINVNVSPILPGGIPAGMPSPVIGPLPGGCAPCSAETAHAAMNSAYQAAQRDTYGGCLDGGPSVKPWAYLNEE